MANETHNGNLNRSKIASAGVEGLKSTGKSNDPEAALRRGKLPKAEAVKTKAEEDKGACLRSVNKQNESATSKGEPIRNVIPNNGRSVVCDCGCE